LAQAVQYQAVPRAPWVEITVLGYLSKTWLMASSESEQALPLL